MKILTFMLLSCTFHSIAFAKKSSIQIFNNPGTAIVIEITKPEERNLLKELVDSFKGEYESQDQNIFYKTLDPFIRCFIAKVTYTKKQFARCDFIFKDMNAKVFPSQGGDGGFALSVNFGGPYIGKAFYDFFPKKDSKVLSVLEYNRGKVEVNIDADYKGSIVITDQ